MQNRALGRTGLHVSALGLGGMMFGWRAGAAEVEQILKTAIDAGINFVDTSGSYGRGASEELLGGALQRLGVRKEVLIATKFGLPSSHTTDQNSTGNSRHNVIRQCESSLRRLAVDHIDLLQIHWPSMDVPIEETLWALDSLVQQGKVRYIGTSNFAAWQIVESLWCSDRRNLIAVSSEQTAFNLLDRRAETDIFRVVDRYGLGLIAYRPLAEGLLTGKYSPDQPFPPDSRFAQATKGGDYRQRMSPRVIQIVETLVDAAPDYGISPATLAISWILTRRQISTVLIGPSANSQVEDVRRASDVRLEPSVVAKLDGLVEPGAAVVA
jgi:aryl-alcohol dehydrogenase-like predicted oxidoreductase